MSKTLLREHLLLIQASYKAGFDRCMEEHGLLKPYISQNQAYKTYGRRVVNRWIDEGLITVIKDGTGTSTCRIKREEIELVAAISNRTSWYEHYEE